MENDKLGIPPERKIRLMVVDDELDFLEIVKLNLEITNRFEILALPEAVDIVNKVHSFEPDIVLLDVLMPKVDGLTAIEMLNNDPMGKKIPIIILSAIDSTNDKLNAYKLGIVDYLSKPVEKSLLISRIEKALEFKNLK